MTTHTILLALGSGSFIGFVLGLIGSGGSILATPLLIYVVGVRDVHTAIGTGALAVSANAYLNLVGHAIRGHVWWRCSLGFAIAGSLGAYLGSSLGKIVDGRSLLFMFGLLMVLISFAVGRTPRHVSGASQEVSVSTYGKMAVVAVLVGLCSGFFGIGGGFLIVPGLLFATGMPLINAAGSSLLAVGVFGMTAAVNYALSGMVDWGLTSCLIIGGVSGGLLGIAASTRLSVRRNALARILQALLFLMGFLMISRSFDPP